MFLYSALLTLAAALSAPLWGWRMAWQGRYREGLGERLGALPAQLRTAVQGKPVVWLHAVSVGEVIAATRLVREMEAALPGHIVVVSTTTPTGQRVARERFGVNRVFYFPLDFAFAVRACLRILQPRLLVLVESELWPRTLMECSRAGIRVVLVNARVSDRSFPRYRALRSLWKPLLRKISLLLAQSEGDAERWISIGVPRERVQVSGNLKFDVIATADTLLVQMLRQHLPAAVPVLVCGSTHDGEERLLLDCVTQPAFPTVVTILAPRHPERTGAVELLAVRRGLPVLRISAWRLIPHTLAPGTVLLVDSVGELATLYALATVAFLGGSLIPHGGQNPLEPARFGVPVLMGPNFENFRSVVDLMRNAGVLTSTSAETLCGSLREHLQAPPIEASRERSRALFKSEAGATQRTIAALLPFIKELR